MRRFWFKKLSIIVDPRSPLSWLILCLISLVTLIVVLGPSSWKLIDPKPRIPVTIFYTSYRRVKEQVEVDYLDLRSGISSVSGQTGLDLCGKERENFVPCYNVSANLLAGFKEGQEFDRHCELLVESDRCLVRPPKEYKIPLRWPTGRDILWSGNVKIKKHEFFSGSMTKRFMLLEDNQIAFHSEDGLVYDDVKDYSRQLAEMIGLGSDSEFPQAGVRTILDINCGFGSFAAHLISLKVMAVCIAAYEATGSQVQLSLERGLPAMIGNFIARQLPYPSLSYDTVHCAQCGIIWDEKDGMFLIEVDRLLKPGGYFILTTSTGKGRGSTSRMKKRDMLMSMEDLTEQLCWTLLAQQDDTFVWQKTGDVDCYASRKKHAVRPVPLCREGDDDAKSYYQPLVPCISGTSSRRWITIQNRSTGSELSSAELKNHGVQPEDYFEELQFWRSALENYWSLLTPLIFSDHPKRPGDEDPIAPFNLIRNVMDMSAKYGALNAALLEEKKSVWVMNVVPAKPSNFLPLILDRGFAGVMHDWCEPFPTYPRTYDMLHANGLLSHLASERCSTIDLFLEMDRILRPEGWVILSDTMGAIEMARSLAAQVRWEARLIDLQNGSDQRLLVCQKPFLKK